MSNQQTRAQSQAQMPPRRPQGLGGGPGGRGPVLKEKPKNAMKSLIRLMRYLGGKPIMLCIAIVMVMLSSLAGVIATSYLKPIINGLTKGADLSILAASLFTMSLIYLAATGLSYASSIMMMRLAQNTSNRIRKELFNHLMDLPINFFDSKSHGEVMSRFTNDVDNINIALEQSLSHLITSIITVVGVFIMMLILSPILTVFIVIMLIIMFFITKAVGKKSASYFRKQQKSLGELNGFIEELMEGQKVVKVFQHETQAKEDFNKRNSALRDAATQAQTFAGLLMPIMGNLSYINYAVTVMVGAVLAIKGQLDLGTIAAFLQYSRSFSMPISQIANQFNSLLSAIAGAERIFDVLDTPVEIDNGDVHLIRYKDIQGSSSKESKDSECTWVWEIKSPDGSVTHTPLKGDIRFQNVTFGYLPEKDVLKEVSLFAKPGQKIAFVGSTGAGKTTITNLINRFYDIRSGQITYDGIDIHKISKHDLRRALGMVLQDVHLFQGTVKDNIRYGNLEATDEEVIQAAKLANAHGFIKKLPKGYDTVLAPDGSNLSQGQRQLLSIARAAVADPPVLILDEATSSVDTHTEKLIEAGMDKLMHGRTTLAIAHRLSTVRNANAIMVLEQGEIIERGDHNDLLDLRGRYYQLYTGASELT